MGDSLLSFLMLNHHPSTLLSMDSSASSSQHDDLDLEMSHQINQTRPPDINLPLSTERISPPQSWNQDQCEVLDVGVGLVSHLYQTESFLNVPKTGRKCAKRVDSIWGAWFFFSFYFRPVLNEKSKTKTTRDKNGLSGFDKSDLNLDVFMVQHDMENMYMWVFKERPENALGKMQLRSYMNGHSRQGEGPFPFSVDKGFVRSHRMQRKHYRGLSNPQCVHGIEVVPSPNLAILDDDELKRWAELTGRDFNFIIPPEASDFSSWRNLPNTEFELERPIVKNNPNSQSRKLLNGSGLKGSGLNGSGLNGSELNGSVLNGSGLNGSVLNGSGLNGSGLNLSTQPSNQTNGDTNGLNLSPICNKKRKDSFPHGNEEDIGLTVNHPNPNPNPLPNLEMNPNDPYWLTEFTGVMKNACGPVTGAKTIYEDESGYLVVISLPFVDLQKVKVSWRNTLTHGIIKVSCISISRMPFIKRRDRTFKLTDPCLEHCPPGEFIREIPLSTRIPEDANLEAYYDGPGSVLEILVPKLREGPEEHEVRVCLRPHLVGNDLMLT